MCVANYEYCHSIYSILKLILVKRKYEVIKNGKMLDFIPSLIILPVCHVLFRLENCYIRLQWQQAVEVKLLFLLF